MIKFRGGRHFWYLFLTIIFASGALAYLISVSPVRPDGQLDRFAILSAIILMALTATTGARFVTHFFWSRRRAGWVGVFSGFATIQILTLASIRLLAGVAIFALVAFNLLLFWYMIRLVQD